MQNSLKDALNLKNGHGERKRDRSHLYKTGPGLFAIWSSAFICRVSFMERSFERFFLTAWSAKHTHGLKRHFVCLAVAGSLVGTGLCAAELQRVSDVLVTTDAPCRLIVDGVAELELRPDLPRPLSPNSRVREVRCVDVGNTGAELVVMVDTGAGAPNTIRLGMALEVQRNELLQKMRQQRAAALAKRRAHAESAAPLRELEQHRPRPIVPSTGSSKDTPSDGLARTETTVAEYRVFVEATGYITEAERPESTVRCGVNASDPNWHSPGVSTGDDHPVVCVSAADAHAYAAWRTAVEGRAVRLPTAAEVLSTLGSEGTHFWGAGLEEACAFANLASHPISHLPEALVCGDPYVHLAPVASFRSDVLGRFDLAGNAAELTSTCASDPSLPPATGVPDAAHCRVWRVVGGSYESAPETLDPQHPIALETGHLVWDEASPATGFRVYRESKP